MADTIHTFEKGLEALRSFLDAAKAPSNVIGDGFPYGTYTIPRPGETKAEPGRRHHKNCANPENIKQARAWVKKHNLDFDDEKYLDKVKTSLILDFGPEAFQQAEETHRQKFRLVEGIASYVAECCDWGHRLVTCDLTILTESLLALWKTRHEMVIDCCQYKSGELNSASGVSVVNRKAQDLASAVSPVDKVIVQVNASAGTCDNLDEGGGVFGDPCYSFTTQEESLYRTFPFEVKIFAQFFLGTYSEAQTSKEVISRFTYYPEVAPGNGRCLAIPVKNLVYFFSAANDNSKTPLIEAAQERLAFAVVSNIFGYAEKHHISNVILGAWGLGVFKGNASCLGNAIAEVIEMFSSHDSEALTVNTSIGYYIRNPKDQDGISNFNVLAKKFGCPPYTP